MNKEIRKMNLKNSLKEFIKNTLLKIRKILIIIAIMAVVITGIRYYLNRQMGNIELDYNNAILTADHTTITESIYASIGNENFSSALEKIDKLYNASNFDSIYKTYTNGIEPRFYMDINRNEIVPNFTQEFQVDKISSSDSSFYVNIVNKSSIPVMYTLSITYEGVPPTFWNYKIEDDFIQASMPEFISRFEYGDVKAGDYLIEIKDERLDKVYFTQTLTVE